MHSAKRPGRETYRQTTIRQTHQGTNQQLDDNKIPEYRDKHTIIHTNYTPHWQTTYTNMMEERHTTYMLLCIHAHRPSPAKMTTANDTT